MQPPTTDKRIDILNRALHGCVNSVLQYIESATPHVSEDQQENYRKLMGMRGEEAALAGELSAQVTALDGIPKVGVFPYWNVDLNYLDLGFMVRFAAKDVEKAIAELESELDLVRDDLNVFRLLERLLEQKRTHLAALRAM